MSSKIRIYTRTGDQGQTSLYGGQRVFKSHPRVAAFGTVDELNSHLGYLITFLDKDHEIKNLLTSIQSDLFAIGSSLAGKSLSSHFLLSRTKEMEKLIDELDIKLPPLNNFILPSGSGQSCLSHIARTVCRRAERHVVSLTKEEGKVDKKIISYLNRLSDLLFVIARYLNYRFKIKDVIWKKLS